MATEGPRFPGTTANLSNAGTSESSDAWVNPGNVASDNASEAQITAASYDSPDISQILVCSNLGFAIPAGATIDGITVEIDRRSIIANSGKDFRVQLAKGTAFANLVGTNKAVPATIWPTSSAVATYGGAADKWGTTWTVAEVNASSFAVFVSCQANIANADVGIDFVRVTVTYTAAAPESHSGTWVATGGGTRPTAGRKDGLSARVLTGGGTVAAAGQKGGLRAVAATGGGTVATSGTKAATRSGTLATGGGTAPRATSGAHAQAAQVTGGGTVAIARTTGRQGSRVVTGGGTAPRAGAKGAQSARALTGGGTVVLAAMKGALRSLAVTGGGVVVVTGEGSSAQDKSGSWVASGGGTIAVAVTTGRRSVVVVQGAGAVELQHATARAGSWAASGGGTVVLQSAGSKSPAQLIAEAAVEAHYGDEAGALRWLIQGALGLYSGKSANMQRVPARQRRGRARLYVRAARELDPQMADPTLQLLARQLGVRPQ